MLISFENAPLKRRQKQAIEDVTRLKSSQSEAVTRLKSSQSEAVTTFCVSN